MIDLTSEHGMQALKKLKSEMVIWLTTVTPNGTPQPRPVWFIWQDNKIIVYSMASAKKLEHIRNNPHVSLQFNMASHNDTAFVFIGQASIIESPTPAIKVNEYIQKYSDEIKGMDATPESFNDAYNVRIEITPTKFRVN